MLSQKFSLFTASHLSLIFRNNALSRSILLHNGQKRLLTTNNVGKGPLESSEKEKKSLASVKPPLMSRIKDGLLHYWHGSKVLAYETKISSGLLLKVLRGEQLIRRERRQLLRTSSDLLRLIPFIIIAIIPFLEFALPVILKLFPNMLPSTFEDKTSAEEKVRKQIKVKLEMAKFLQDALEQMSSKGSVSAETKEFSELYKKARLTGESLNLTEIERVCHALRESLTVDNLDRSQLISLSKYLGMKAFGTDSFLKFQVRRSLKNIHRDDQEIAEEGVDSLYSSELEQACRLRGLYYTGIGQALMRHELSSWLTLHLEKGIPTVLLVLSKALSPNMSLLKPEAALKETLANLSDAIAHEAVLNHEARTDTESLKQKLVALEEQQILISEELAQANFDQKLSTGKVEISKDEIKEISETITAAASGDPVHHELKQLEMLKAEIVDFKRESESSEIAHEAKLSGVAEIITAKLDKLITEIEVDIQSLRDKLSDRLGKLSLDEKGRISVEQIEAIFRHVKNDPAKYSQLEEIIKAFDSDGDGKVLIGDILSMAKKAEERNQGMATKQKPDTPESP